MKTLQTYITEKILINKDSTFKKEFNEELYEILKLLFEKYIPEKDNGEFYETFSQYDDVKIYAASKSDAKYLPGVCKQYAIYDKQKFGEIFDFIAKNEKQNICWIISPDYSYRIKSFKNCIRFTDILKGTSVCLEFTN